MSNTIKKGVRIEIEGEAKSLLNSVDKANEALNSLSIGTNSQLVRDLRTLENAVKRVDKQAGQTFTHQTSFDKLNQDLGITTDRFSTVLQQLQQMQNLSAGAKIKFLPDDIQKQLSTVSAIKKQADDLIQQLKQIPNLQSNANYASLLSKIKTAQDRVNSTGDSKKLVNKTNKKLQKQATTVFDTITIENYEKAIQEFKRQANANYDLRRSAQTTITKLQGENQVDETKLATSANAKTTASIQERIDRRNKRINSLQGQIPDMTKNIEDYEKRIKEIQTIIQKYEILHKSIEDAEKELNDLNSSKTRLEDQYESSRSSKIAAIHAKLTSAGEAASIDMSQYSDVNETNINGMISAIEEYQKLSVKPVNDKINEAVVALQNYGDTTDKAKDKVADFNGRLEEQNEVSNNIQGILNRINTFAGFAGAMNIAQKAAHNAMKSIKELDAQMTQMAVVTNENIGGYWDQLPEYTERANQLGVSIKSVYEAATLYYQQGLKTNEVIGVSNATLKLARIAGLNAADATNKVTAALRGFGMEVNETNATKIADVYSKLAAITASDVNEISTAMSAVASIASSANMEFENTAAFLAQIIQTTRESATTAGTALKTIVARFQELKKDPSEIGTIDGETVDANAIETALRSVGVALRDTNGQFRDLDDVFLDLSKKWDTLDMNTKRYIATIAAGSRQQSRFVALMQDYATTSQLITAANNAAGASTEQYNKTLESLETKLNNLQNAWDSFSMSIVDSDLIKWFVDFGTELMTMVNNVTNATNSTAINMGLKIGAISATTKLANSAIKVFTGSIKETNGQINILGAAGKTFTAGFSKVKSVLTNATIAVKAFAEGGDENATRTENIVGRVTNAINALKEAKAGLGQEEQDILNDELEQEADEDNWDEWENGVARATQGVEEHQSAIERLTGVYKLTNEQQVVMVQLQSKGYKNTIAAQMAHSGLTDEMIQEYAAEHHLNYELEKNNIAQQLSQKATKQNILVRIWQNLVTKTNTDLQNENSLAFKLNAKYQTKYNKSLSVIALTAVRAGAAIAALIAIIWAMIAVHKAIQSTSTSSQLSKLSEAYSQMKEQAQDAADATDDLTESLSELQSKYEALDKLTQGTQEWSKQLKEVNSEMAELVIKYNTLGKYASIDSNGVYRITEENQKTATQEMENIESQAKVAEISAQVMLLKKQQEKSYEDLSAAAVYGDQTLARAAALEASTTVMTASAAAGAGTGALVGSAGMFGLGTIGGVAIGGIGGGVYGAYEAFKDDGIYEQTYNAIRESQQTITDALATAISEGSIEIDDDAIRDFLKENGLDGIEINQWLSTLHEDNDAALTELKTYGDQLVAKNAQIDALVTSVRSEVMTMVDASSYSTKIQQEMLQSVSQSLVEAVEDSKVEELNKTNLKHNADYTSYWQDVYGSDYVGVTSSGAVKYKDSADKTQTIEADTAKKIFADVASSTQIAKDIEEGFVSMRETLIDQATKIDSGNEHSSSQITQAVDNLLLQNDGINLTRENLDVLKGLNIKDIWEEVFTDDMRDIFGDDISIFEELFKQTETAQARLANAIQYIETNGITVSNTEQMSAGTIEGLADQSKKLFQAGATDQQVNDIMKQVSMIIAGYSDEDRNTFLTAFNGIENLQSKSAYDTFLATLESSDLNYNKQQIYTLINTMEDVAEATEELDFDSLLTKLQTLNSTLVELKKGTITRNLSEEIYESLVEGNSELVDSFVRMNDGTYQYIGEKIDDLIKALTDNTQAKIEESINQLETKIGIAEMSKKVTSQVEGGHQYDYENITEATTRDQREYLATFLEQAAKNNLNVSALGVGINNKTTRAQVMDEDTFSSSEIQNIVSAIITNINDQSANEISLKQNQVSSETTSALANSATQNIANLIAARKAMTVNGLTDQELIDLENKVNGITNALKAQYTEFGVSEQQFEQYAKDVNALTNIADKESDVYKQLTASIQSFEEKLTDQVAYNTSATNMKTAMGKINTFVENYRNAANDIERESLTAQTANLFGIGVNDENYETVASLLAKYAEGDVNAYTTLLQMKLQDMGTSLEAIQSERLDENNRAIAEQLANYGLGWIEEVEDGSQYFRAFTEAQVQQSAKLADGVKEAWDNTYDYLYNLNSKINQLVKQRERLERQYTRLTQQTEYYGVTSAETLTASLQAQISILRQESERASSRASSASQKIIDTYNAAAADSGWRDVVAISDGQIAIDYNKLSDYKYNTDQGSAITEWIGELEELLDELTTAEEDANTVNDNLYNLMTTGQEEYDNLLSDLRDAMIQLRQDEIDNLSNINTAINEAASELNDKMQEQIDDERKAREDEKTRQTLADKAQRLAYLRRDTSGANANEILTLEQELQDAQEDYQDSLVDDMMSDIQDANQKAQEQREEQIKIAQAQLDYWGENASWDAAEKQLTSDLRNGFADSLSERMLATNATLGMTENQRAQWKQEMENTAALASVTMDGSVKAQAADAITDNLSNEKNILTNWKNATVGDSDLLTTINQQWGNSQTAAAYWDEKWATVTKIKDAVTDGTSSAVENANDDSLKGYTIEQLKAPVKTYAEWMDSNYYNANRLDENGDIMSNQSQYSQYVGLVNDVQDTNYKVRGYRLFEGSTDLSDTPASARNVYKNLEDYTTAELEARYDYDTWLEKYNLTRGTAGIDANNEPKSEAYGKWLEYNTLSAKYQDYLDKFKSGIYKLINGTVVSSNVSLLTEKTHGEKTYNNGDITKIESNGNTYYTVKSQDGKTTYYLNPSAYLQDSTNNLWTPKPGTSHLLYYSNDSMQNYKDWETYKKWNVYATGGLADYTGPAWLDGTAAHPELVLNARDTENFIALKDVLSKLMNNGVNNSTTTTNGDNYYDVDVNVESIDTDYDVEKIASKIKALIKQDAMYRNVVAIQQK